MRQKICYLCGLDLEKKKSRDHVPPKKFYSPEIRLRYKTKLLTLPAHETCNRDFQKDEDYLVATLAPLVQDSYSGGSLYRHWLQTYEKGKQVPLARAVLAEFDPRPSGLVLPGNRVVKRLDGKRVDKAIWKIVRGLFFKEYGRLLPAYISHSTRITSPNYPPSAEFAAIADAQEHGDHKGVFAYKYKTFPEVNNLHFWGLLLWDRIIITVAFHDPSCLCARCSSAKTEHEKMQGIKNV